MRYATLGVTVINGMNCFTVTDIYDEEVQDAIVCGDSVTVGDVYHGGGFFNRAAFERGKPARTKADAVADKITEIEELARTKRIAIAGSDNSKRDTYTIKYEVAMAALAGNQTAIALLTPEATARGETATELATLVVQLGGQWRYAALAIDATYQTHKAAVLAMLAGESTIEDIDAYNHTTGWIV